MTQKPPPPATLRAATSPSRGRIVYLSPLPLRGRCREATEGACVCYDVGNDAVQIIDDVSGINPQRPNPALRQPSIARKVMGDGEVVRLAVDLNAQSHGRTVEVEHIGSRWMLLAKTETGLTSA